MQSLSRCLLQLLHNSELSPSLGPSLMPDSKFLAEGSEMSGKKSMGASARAVSIMMPHGDDHVDHELYDHDILQNYDAHEDMTLRTRVMLS